MDLTLPPTVTDRAFARLAEINADAEMPKALRVAVEGGGCSGFHYDIRLDETERQVEGTHLLVFEPKKRRVKKRLDDPEDDDLVLEGEGQKVVVDSVSLPFLSNAVIDFTEELIGARFTIDNPNATSSCGCGTSFSM